MLTRLRRARAAPVGRSNRAPIVAKQVRFSSVKPEKTAFFTTRDVWTGTAFDINTPAEATALKDFVATHKAGQAALLQAHPELSPQVAILNATFKEASADQNGPIRVAVTGASGQIGYALIYRIASGAVFGPKTPVQLQLLELPQAMGSLKGVEMELRDCAFPNLAGVVLTDKPEVAFEGVDYALLVGAQPRTKGMERADLLLKNAEIFSVQGKALNSAAKGKDTRVVVVGNPANTNALIASRNAPKIPAENFSAMTRLDHNRGLAQLAEKLKVGVTDIQNFIIWGNHSPTMFPDISHATVNGTPVAQLLNDDEWVRKVFTPAVQQRGAAVIAARGSSSAASAASSLMNAVRNWHYGTMGQVTSAAVVSKGEYGIEPGLFFSYPVTYDSNQSWSVVQGLPQSEYAQQMLKTTENELKAERDGVAKLLPN